MFILPTIDDFYDKVTRVWEKGKVNHPSDPGGATNDGVATHFITEFASNQKGADFLRSIGIEPRFIYGYMNKQAKEKTKIFDPNLLMSFTPDQCKKILIESFWVRTALKDVPCRLAALATFDLCLNSGASRGKKFLQMACNDFAAGREPLVEDGILGPKSFARFSDFTNVNADYELSIQVCYRRERFLRGLSTFPSFGKGWLNRVNAVRDYLRRKADV